VGTGRLSLSSGGGPNIGREAWMPTSRVKIPVTLIFDVMRALNENMTRYEGVFGAIRRPGQEGDDEPGDIIGNKE
jgi:hypothetical protein